ncbi:ASC1-like protein 2 [Diplonema papillatum]|nr:ASC1-like protein 2 [Diplonema papillatum]
MITAYVDHADVVPHPLQVADGETEVEELARAKVERDGKKKERLYNESVRAERGGPPSGRTTRFSSAAADALKKAQEFASDVELRALQKTVVHERKHPADKSFSFALAEACEAFSHVARKQTKHNLLSSGRNTVSLRSRHRRRRGRGGLARGHRPMITAYVDHADVVPHPLPVADGETEVEELARAKVERDGKKKERLYNESVRAERGGPPSGLTTRFSSAAADALKKAQEFASDVELRALQKTVAHEKTSRDKSFALAFPQLHNEGEACEAFFHVACWHSRAQRSLPGLVYLTQRNLLFNSEDGRFTIPWSDVLSLQKAVELPSYPPNPPYFFNIHHPNVEWDALQVYCARGRLYQFHKIRGGPLLRVGFPKALRLLFLHCDRLWRAAVDVEQLLSERSDFGKKWPNFDYTVPEAANAVHDDDDDEFEELPVGCQHTLGGRGGEAHPPRTRGGPTMRSVALEKMADLVAALFSFGASVGDRIFFHDHKGVEDVPHVHELKLGVAAMLFFTLLRRYISGKKMANYIGVTLDAIALKLMNQWISLAVHFLSAVWAVIYLPHEAWVRDVLAGKSGVLLDGVAGGETMQLSVPLKVFYMLHLGYQMHQLLFTVQENASFPTERRADYRQMLLHHIIAVSMIAISYVMGYERIGLMVMVSHSISDIPTSLTKSAKLLGWRRTSLFLLPVMIIVWLLTRLLFFPFYVLNHVFEVEYWTLTFDHQLAYVVCVMGLLTLLFLNLFWFVIFLQMAANAALFGNSIDVTENRKTNDMSENRDIWAKWHNRRWWEG